MAYVPRYQYDVFVSYAHDDNLCVGAQTKGWVSKLREDLEVIARQYGLREFHLFMDYEGLGPNRSLTKQLVGALEESALLLVVLSPAYLASPWCTRERATFLDKLDPDDGRLFVVTRRPPVLFPEDPPCPPPLDDMIGARFYKGNPPRVSPLDPFSSEKDNLDFMARIEALGTDLVRELKKLKRDDGEGGAGTKTGTEPGTEPPGPGPVTEPKARVFLAEVSPDLDEERSKVKSYLANFDIETVPDRYYPPDWDAAKLQRQVLTDLETCAVFAQVLGASPDSRARLQFDAAQGAGKKLFVWRDPELPLERVRDPAHREFLGNDHVRKEGLKSFEKAVAEEALKPPPPPPKSSADAWGPCVFVHLDEADRSLGDAVMQALTTHQADGIELADTGDGRDSERSAAELAQDFENFLVEADALILIRGDNDRWFKYQWLRLRKALPKVMKRRDNNLEIAIYDGPPPDKPPLPVVAPNLHVLDCRQSPEELEKFLAQLEEGTA